MAKACWATGDDNNNEDDGNDNNNGDGDGNGAMSSGATGYDNEDS